MVATDSATDVLVRSKILHPLQFQSRFDRQQETGGPSFPRPRPVNLISLSHATRLPANAYSNRRACIGTYQYRTALYVQRIARALKIGWFAGLQRVQTNDYAGEFIS